MLIETEMSTATATARRDIFKACNNDSQPERCQPHIGSAYYFTSSGECCDEAPVAKIGPLE